MQQSDAWGSDHLSRVKVEMFRDGIRACLGLVDIDDKYCKDASLPTKTQYLINCMRLEME